MVRNNDQKSSLGTKLETLETGFMIEDLQLIDTSGLATRLGELRRFL